MTCEDVVPLSAVATICDGQFENTGAETSVKEKNIYLKKHTQQQQELLFSSLIKENKNKFVLISNADSFASTLIKFPELKFLSSSSPVFKWRYPHQSIDSQAC